MAQNQDSVARILQPGLGSSGLRPFGADDDKGQLGVSSHNY